MFRRSLILGVAGVLVCIAALPPSARAADRVVWSRQAGNSLAATDVDRRGNIYVTGYASPDTFDPRMILRKFGPAGKLLWARKWDPQGIAFAYGNDVKVGFDGNVYVVGDILSGHFEGGGWFVRKYTAAGKLLWTWATPGWKTGGVAETATGVAAGSGLVVVSVTHYGCCADPFSDGFVRGFSTDGRPLWTNPFEFPGIPHRFYDRASDVSIGALGRSYVVGRAALENVEPESPAHWALVVTKLASNGTRIWTHTFRHLLTAYPAVGTSVAVRGDILVVAGLVHGYPIALHTGHPGDAWLGRFSFDGGLRWSKTWGTEKWNAAEPTAVAIDPAGGVHVVGTIRRGDEDHLNFFWRSYKGRSLTGWVLLDQGRRLLYGTGVAPISGGVAATGHGHKDGLVWRLRS